MNIYQKLLGIKRKVPYLKQDGKSFNYKYVTPEMTLGEINPLLLEAGIVVIPAVLDVQAIAIPHLTDKKPKDAEMLFITRMEYRIINAENPEEMIIIPWAGTGCNGDEKGFGSALTYAERYFILKLFQIATGDEDPDAKPRNQQDAAGQPSQRSVPIKPAIPVDDEATADAKKTMLTELTDAVKNNHDRANTLKIQMQKFGAHKLVDFLSMELEKCVQVYNLCMKVFGATDKPESAA